MPKSDNSKWQGLGVLVVVALFNYIDRQALSILQVPIKRELGLSDTQLGALTGLAFALVYTTLALPVARFADRRSRKLIIAGALAVWSVMTAGCGLATGFVTLVIFRMGVAFGEAGCVPASHALISDFFPREQRATAIALWTLSMPLGTMLGFAAGGVLNQWLGWRNAFLVLGATGLALAPLVLILLREPPRGAHDPVAAAAPQALGWQQALRVLWKLRAFRHAAIGGALVAYTYHAIINWNAPFYSRVFEMSMSEMGLYLALCTGLGGGIGIYLGGSLADRLGRRDVRWYLWVPAVASLAVLPFMLLQYLAADLQWSMASGFMTAALLNAFMPPLVATAQTLVPAGMRAFTSAVLVLVVNIIGLGLGPLATGFISDLLITHYGQAQDSLRYAIAASALVALWGAWHFWRAASYLPLELPGRTAADGVEGAQPSATPLPQRH